MIKKLILLLVSFFIFIFSLVVFVTADFKETKNGDPTETIWYPDEDYWDDARSYT